MVAIQLSYWSDDHPTSVVFLVRITPLHTPYLTSAIETDGLLAHFSNPIQDATASTIACNDDGTAGALQLTATVAAGSKITAYWNQVWPHPYGPMVQLTSFFTSASSS